MRTRTGNAALFSIAILLGTCGVVPDPATGQDTIQVDTVPVTVARAINRAVIVTTPAPFRGLPGDTFNIAAYGLTSAGDSVPISVNWIQTPTALLDITPLTGSTAIAVIRAGTSGQQTDLTVEVVEVDSVRIGYLEDGTRTWTWADLDPPTIAPGDTLRLCAAVYFNTGDVGIGSIPECTTEYNALALTRLYDSMNRVAAGMRTWGEARLEPGWWGISIGASG